MVPRGSDLPLKWLRESIATGETDTLGVDFVGMQRLAGERVAVLPFDNVKGFGTADDSEYYGPNGSITCPSPRTSPSTRTP